MKKILEVIRQGQIGGGESHLMDLIYFLDRTKYQPICLSFTDGEMIRRLKAMGIKCIVIKSNNPFDLRVQNSIRKILKEEKIDLVHAHGSRAASNVLYPAKCLHIPFVYTVHGWSFHDDQKIVVKKVRSWSEKFICHFSDTVICVSKSNAETGKKTFGLENSIVIENGINLEVFDRNKDFADRRKNFHFSEEDFVVGFIARATKQKNPLLFLESLKLAHSRDNKVKGLFVGEGDMDSDVDSYIIDNHMEGFLFRSLFRTDVPELLNCIDVYCLPSLWEGLSIALLEAMAMGKAILATPTDGTKELIQDRENGIVIDYNKPDKIADAIIELHNNTNLFFKCCNNASLLIEKRFNARRVAESVMEIYSKYVS